MGALLGCSELVQTLSDVFHQPFPLWVVVVVLVLVCHGLVACLVEKTFPVNHLVDVESPLGPKVEINNKVYVMLTI